MNNTKILTTIHVINIYNATYPTIIGHNSIGSLIILFSYKMTLFVILGSLSRLDLNKEVI